MIFGPCPRKSIIILKIRVQRVTVSADDLLFVCDEADDGLQWRRLALGRHVRLTRHTTIILSSLYYLLLCYIVIAYYTIKYNALCVNATEYGLVSHERYFEYLEYFDCNITIILSILCTTPTCLFFMNIYAYIANVSGWWENSAGARLERDGKEEK